ncbi:hypothetical protein [Olsenella urininfantis]|uniref:hypothetical protein n=1 Tax=Olsenella urininfantis TaxID=1871033 RepID=UPI00098756D7|nr:hypothetical protein [Olsenella urininfantis]
MKRVRREAGTPNHQVTGARHGNEATLRISPARDRREVFLCGLLLGLGLGAMALAAVVWLWAVPTVGAALVAMQ